MEGLRRHSGTDYTQEAAKRIVRLDDDKPEAVDLFLTALYHGTTSTCHKTLFKHATIYAMAKKYEATVTHNVAFLAAAKLMSIDALLNLDDSCAAAEVLWTIVPLRSDEFKVKLLLGLVKNPTNLEDRRVSKLVQDIPDFAVALVHACGRKMRDIKVKRPGGFSFGNGSG